MKYHFKHYKLLLLFFDVLTLFFSFSAVYYFKFGTFLTTLEIQVLSLFIVLCIFVFFILDLYNPWSHFSKLPMHYRSLIGIVIITILYLFFSFIFSSYQTKIFESKWVFVFSLLFISFLFFVNRYYFYILLDPERLGIRWLVIATLENAKEFQKEIELRGGKWEIFYLLDKNSYQKVKKEKDINLKIIGELDSDFQQVINLNWTGIILAKKDLDQKYINSLIEVRQKGLPIYDLVYFYEYFFFKIPLYYIDESWFLLSQRFMLIENSAVIRIKHIIDRVIAAFLLILFAPIMLIIALAIYLDDGLPILFKQERLGKNKKTFIAYKFRTMIKDADKYNPLTQENDSRITKAGRFLRKSRLDELPQLFNIIKGEMSLIGPRAESIKVTQKYEKEIKYYHFRHLVEPGLIGWAQVMYSYASTIEDEIQKIEYDLYYIKNYSFLLDLSILIKTVRIVLFSRGR
jgi:exopolysaccharide biosynthesis polyprenyl glycosylphosphotransferase